MPAQVHAIIAIPLAIKSLQSTILAKDPVFGYDAFVGNALAFSAGYVQCRAYELDGIGAGGEGGVRQRWGS
jgi:hypothetical protein